MCSKGFDRLVLFGVLALGLAVGGLALLNHRHRTPPVMPAAENSGSLERSVPARLHLPAPRLSAGAPQTEPEQDARSSNLLARLIKGEELPKLTPEQVESYLASKPPSPVGADGGATLIGRTNSCCDGAA
jgi:hypothetical protein